MIFLNVESDVQSGLVSRKLHFVQSHLRDESIDHICENYKCHSVVVFDGDFSESAILLEDIDDVAFFEL